MTDQTQRLEIATVRAEIGSNITYRFNNDAIDAGGIPTESGDIKNLKLIIKEIEDKASVSTSIYTTVADGLAATEEGGMFLVQSDVEAEIYVVWRKTGGVAVDTGKRALSSQAAEDAVNAAQASADASEASATAAQESADSAADLVNRSLLQVGSIAELRTVTGRYNGDRVSILGYYADTPGVGTKDRYWVAASTKDDNGGSVIAVTGEAVGRWEFSTAKGVWVEDFGARNDGTDTAGTTAAIWAAIRSMRSFETSLIQYIAGPTITAYKSGVLQFGRGVFSVSPDTLEITQDLGLKIVGQGSRGKNQAIPAATTMLFTGTSSGFGIRHYGNGARSLTIESMDVCYLDSSFTGDLVDSFSSPGLRIANSRLGCYGGFAGTRVQTARSLVRSTYDEFMRFESVVFDGTQDGWWSDNSRSLGGSIFGGWGTSFVGCTFYDIANRGITHDLTRSRSVVNVTQCAFNPINIDPVRSIDVENIEGLAVEGNQFTPSTSHQPTAEWLRIRGSTGRVSENTFSGSTSKVGTIGGGDPSLIEWSSNRISCSDGITIAGGVITGGGNEYSNATNGVLVSPIATVSLDIGPDVFKSGVNMSYSIPADSTFLGGRIKYSPEQDTSNSRFSNASTRITIRCTDERIVTIATLPSTGSVLASGRTYNITAAGTFTLPAPSLGVRLRVMKTTNNALTIAATAGSNFVTGATATRTSAVATAAELGSGIDFVALSSTTWIAQVLSGTWTFS